MSNRRIEEVAFATIAALGRRLGVTAATMERVREAHKPTVRRRANRWAIGTHLQIDALLAMYAARFGVDDLRSAHEHLTTNGTARRPPDNQATLQRYRRPSCTRRYSTRCACFARSPPAR